MNYLIIDNNKLLLIEDLCLIGLSKIYISIEQELCNKLNIEYEKLNSILNCNNINYNKLNDKELIKSRMICCNVLQQAIRYKPKPNSYLITKLITALNMNLVLPKFPPEPIKFTGDLLSTQSPGISRMLCTITSPKSDSSKSFEILKNEAGFTEEELKYYTDSYTIVLSNISMAGSVLKVLCNFSDLNLGLLCESMSISLDFLLVPELQKTPNVIDTVRNLLWLTEDSKIIPKKGGDENIKSLVSSYVVLSGEFRNLSESLLKEVSRISSSAYLNVVQTVNKAWNETLKSRLNTLVHVLKNLMEVFQGLTSDMLVKYGDMYNQAIQTGVEGLNSKSQNISVEEYESTFYDLRERQGGMSGDPSLKMLENLSDLYTDYCDFSLSLSLNLLNLRELNEYKAIEKKSKSIKALGQKSVLGHGNELYKEFLDKEMSLGDKYCDSEILKKISSLFNGCNILNFTNKLENLLVPQNQKTRLPKLPKGTMDFLPPEMLVRRMVINAIREIFRQHGAVEVDTPIFELKETFLGKYGEDQKLIFDMKDQGGEQLSLRYDLTVPFARYVAMNKLEKIKRFHIGKVYRRDEPQLTKGRYREFLQCDLDCAGEYSNMVPDSEVIFILVRILRLLKGEGFYVKVNHRKILDSLLEHCGVDKSLHRKICSSIDKMDKLPWQKVRNEMVNEKGLSENVAEKIREFTEIRGNFTTVIKKLKEQPLKTLEQYLEEMELLWSYLSAFGVKEKEVLFDLSLARGLDYYTGVIFEATLQDEEVGSVGGGGRYDELVGMFSGKTVPAVGMSVGIERLFRTIPKQTYGDLTDVFVCTVGSPSMFIERMKLCSLLWKEGINAEFLFNANANLRKQMDAAIDKNVSLIVLVGDSEVESGTVKIKRISYKDEERLEDLTIGREDMVKLVKSLLSQHTKFDKVVKSLFNI